MRKILFGVLFAFLCGTALMAQQNTQRKMQIKLKAGNTVEYVTSDVENITFVEEGGDVDPEEFSVKFTVEELTSTSARVVITPSNDTRYYVGLWQQSFMQNTDGTWLKDEEIIKTCIGDPNFADKCYTGPHLLQQSNFLAGAKMAIIVFDAAALNGEPAAVFKHALNIPEGEKPEDQFVVSNVDAGFTSVKFHVVPKDASQTYVARLVETEWLEKADNSVMQNFYFGINNNAVERQMSISEYVARIGKKGEADFEFTGLKANFAYSIVVFYVDPDNDDVNNVYDWNFTRANVITQQPTASVSLEVTNVRRTANADGTYKIMYDAKSVGATRGLATLKAAKDIEPYLNEDWEKWSDLFLGFKNLPQSQIDEMNSAQGGTFGWDSIDAGDYYVAVRVYNAEGASKTIAVKVE